MEPPPGPDHPRDRTGGETLVSTFTPILGRSRAAEAIRQFGRRAALVDAPVLLIGETGTGKGLLARAIHAASARRRQPFVAVNCAAVPETLIESEFFGHNRGAFTGAHEMRRGLFEQANRGTLFLDEIGDLPLQAQAKLLTAIEDGEIRRLGGERTIPVDTRIVAATGVDLARAVHERTFRRDLYYRLHVLAFRLPALRERDGDIEFLARHFLQHYNQKYRRRIQGLDAAAMATLEKYPWPGNVRELAHTIEAAVLACDSHRIAREHLPQPLLDPAPTTTEGPATPHERYSFHGPPEVERQRIREALERYRGNKTRAAAALGMARNTLLNKLRTLDIDPDKPRR